MRGRAKPVRVERGVGRGGSETKEETSWVSSADGGAGVRWDPT